MNTYNTVSWRQRFVVVAATIVFGSGTLEVVIGAMKFPVPELMAMRQQVLTAQSERAFQLRTLQHGELKVAAVVRALQI